GQLHSYSFLHVQYLPDAYFLQMVGTGRIPGCRPNSFIAFFDQFFVSQIFISCVSPIFNSHLPVKIFCKSFSKPVREGFYHYRIIIVMICLKFLSKLLCTKTCGHTKTTHIVLNAGFLWSNKIGKSEIWFAFIFFKLLSKGSEI